MAGKRKAIQRKVRGNKRPHPMRLNIKDFSPLGLVKQFNHTRHTANQWLYHDDIEIYVRIAYRVIEGNMEKVFDIANVNVPEKKRGKGIFTRLLKEIERTIPYKYLHVENVHNSRVRSFLLEQGYTQDGICFYKNCTERA